MQTDLPAIARRWAASLPPTPGRRAALRFAETGRVSSATERAELAAFAALDCLPLIRDALSRDPGNTRLMQHVHDLTALQNGALMLPIKPERATCS